MRLPLVLATLLSLSTGALAQSIPAGACLMPDGQWCWPTEPTIYGQPCYCSTAGGLVQGVTQ